MIGEPCTTPSSDVLQRSEPSAMLKLKAFWALADPTITCLPSVAGLLTTPPPVATGKPDRRAPSDLCRPYRSASSEPKNTCPPTSAAVLSIESPVILG